MVKQATVDVRIQTIMLAWAFGALLEGLVGFGYPWAVVVPILVGLGIVDLEAIRVAALANNAPVSYGALGSPILALAAVTGLPLLSLSASVGDIVAVLALLPPFVLIYLVSGWDGMVEAWPLAIVGSFSYILGQWPVAHYLGPYLPDLSGALVSFWILFLFVKDLAAQEYSRLWRKIIPAAAAAEAEPRDAGMAVPGLAALPGADCGGGALDRALVASAGDQLVQAVGPRRFPRSPTSRLHRFSTSLRLSGGTSILASWIVIVLLLRPSVTQLGGCLRGPSSRCGERWLVAFFIFGIAYIFVFTGMANSLAYGLSKDRLGVCGSGADPGLDRRGAVRQQHLDQRDVRSHPGGDRQIAASAGAADRRRSTLWARRLASRSRRRPRASACPPAGLCAAKAQVIRHNMAWTLIFLAYLMLIGLLFYFVLPHAMMM